MGRFRVDPKRLNNRVLYKMELLNNIELSLEKIVVQSFTDHFITQKYVGWLNDKAVVRFSEQRHYHHTISSCKQYFKSFSGTNNHFLAIVSKDKKIGHIGNITAIVDKTNSTVDLSILIGERRVWNQGLGLLAWEGVQKYFLESLQFRIVTAGTMIVNKPMLRIFEKSKMVTDCVRPKMLLLNQKEVDIVYASKRLS